VPPSFAPDPELIPLPPPLLEPAPFAEASDAGSTPPPDDEVSEVPPPGDEAWDEHASTSGHAAMSKDRPAELEQRLCLMMLDFEGANGVLEWRRAPALRRW
jgi:hypothetical protein